MKISASSPSLKRLGLTLIKRAKKLSPQVKFFFAVSLLLLLSGVITFLIVSSPSQSIAIENMLSSLDWSSVYSGRYEQGTMEADMRPLMPSLAAILITFVLSSLWIISVFGIMFGSIHKNVFKPTFGSIGGLGKTFSPLRNIGDALDPYNRTRRK